MLDVFKLVSMMQEACPRPKCHVGIRSYGTQGLIAMTWHYGEGYQKTYTKRVDEQQAGTYHFKAILEQAKHDMALQDS